MSVYRIAIVGAGPAGYFAAQALQNLQSETQEFSIDMFERLPTPWGLVRSGVAPDHPKIKSVSKVFEKIASTSNFRLLGNVEVGKDISVATLKDLYDAVILAVGTPIGKRLGVEGDNLPNVVSSANFVSWYNGHPDFRNLDIDLDETRAVIIGAGNVAMDVGRILAVDPKELDATDAPLEVLERLHASRIREVIIAARRGAESASFTAPELRELPDISSFDVIIDKKDVHAALEALGTEPERHVKSNLETMQVISDSPRRGASRSLQFLFGHRPVRINGKSKVVSVTFETLSGEIEIPCSLVVTAIGYLPVALDGTEIDGNHYRNTDGMIEDGLYVVGWAKRGPSGVIGTNKSDATEVVQSLVRNLKAPKEAKDVLSMLSKQGITVIDQSGWTRINAEELQRGSMQNRPREKILDVDEMLEVAKNN